MIKNIICHKIATTITNKIILHNTKQSSDLSLEPLSQTVIYISNNQQWPPFQQGQSLGWHQWYQCWHCCQSTFMKKVKACNVHTATNKLWQFFKWLHQQNNIYYQYWIYPLVPIRHVNSTIMAVVKHPLESLMFSSF